MVEREIENCINSGRDNFSSRTSDILVDIERDESDYLLVVSGPGCPRFVATVEQLEVIFHRANGKTNNQVAREMDISLRAVTRHVCSLMNLNEESRGYRPTVTQLAVEAESLGLLTEISLLGIKTIAEGLRNSDF